MFPGAEKSPRGPTEVERGTVACPSPRAPGETFSQFLFSVLNLLQNLRLWWVLVVKKVILD